METQQLPKLPINISDFRELREGNFYYVDKSLMVEAIDNGYPAMMITRPKRFGRTLNLSMLRYFFDPDTGGEGYAHLFDGTTGVPLAISKSPAWKKQGQHPTVFLSLKDCTGNNWEEMMAAFSLAVQHMCRIHQYLLNDSNAWWGKDQEEFQAIVEGNASSRVIWNGLSLITNALHKFHGKEVLVLIDDYDTPLLHAQRHGFYSALRENLFDMFGRTLKGNNAVYRGVICGTLRIIEESMFSGFNNVIEFTVLDRDYANMFGFTLPEAQSLLNAYGLINKLDHVNESYGGYQTVGYQLFNPWATLHYIQAPHKEQIPHWANTSQNSYVKEWLSNMSAEYKQKLATLVEGISITWPVKEYTQFLKSGKPDDLFSFLVFCGYLNATFTQQEYMYREFTLTIPNQKARAFLEEYI